MEKKRLTRKTEILDLHHDLNMDPVYEGYVIEAWVDPALKYVVDVLSSMLKPSEELRKMEEEAPDDAKRLLDNFISFIHNCILDTNVEGFNLETKKDIEDCLTSVELPQAFVYQVVLGYLGRILSKSSTIKKKLTESSLVSNSGNDSKEPQKQTNKEQ